jgi:hypothetical protein
MENDELELMEAFQKLLPENRLYALAYIRAVRIFQKESQNACCEQLGAIPSAAEWYGPHNVAHQKRQ